MHTVSANVKSEVQGAMKKVAGSFEVQTESVRSAELEAENSKFDKRQSSYKCLMLSV